MDSGATLVLFNARALTFDPLNPVAEAVAVAGERIVAVGATAQILDLRRSGTEVIDCMGLPLIPGINDAHTHILATAASLSGLDCRSPGIDSVSRLLAAIRERAMSLPPGDWIRGYGLESVALREQRYPTLQELDAAAPDHPLRLEHSSGHAALLNGKGLAAAGIRAATPDPADGVIERDWEGEPTGLLLEMGGFLRDRLGNTRTTEEMESGISRLSEALLRYGVTSVQDAGPENGLDRWETFKSLAARQVFRPRISMMAGISRLNEMVEAGLNWGDGEDLLRLGHAKIMLTCTTGQLQPAPEDLLELKRRARELGFPIAVHAIEGEAVSAAIGASASGQAANSGAGVNASSCHGPVKNRIEHCAECPPHLLEKLARSGAMVVTQPGFIYWRGDRYLEQVEPDLLPHLYCSKDMLGLQVPVAFGSDSPVIDPNPWPGIYSAVSGMTRGGSKFPRTGGGQNSAGNGANGMTLIQALSAHTLAGAVAEGTEDRKGMIMPGMLADLALLDRPLDEMRHHGLLETKSSLTIIGGRVVWRDEVI